jgi:hypothetical protein
VGCLPVNGFHVDSKGMPHYTNKPPLWPAAQCFLKAPLAARMPRVPSNCTCVGTPRPACPVDSRLQLCTDICPASNLSMSSNVVCGRRRGFSLGAPLASPSASHCEAACEARDDCIAWSWTGCAEGAPGRCSLKNLVGRVEDQVVPPGGRSFFCTATKKYPALAADPVPLRSSASPNNFTTWVYLQNPYHRVRHKSGMWRVHDQLNGMAIYPGSAAPKDPIEPSPCATLFMAVSDASGRNQLLTAEDYDRGGVERTSPVHTKSRLAIAHGGVETTYFQVSENVLAARVLAAESVHPIFVILQLDSGKGGKQHDVRPGIYTVHRLRDAIIAEGGPQPGVWGLTFDSGAPISSPSFYSSLPELRAALAGGKIPPPTVGTFTSNSSLLY